MGWIVHLVFFYKNGFGIKSPTKFDMQLNFDMILKKETNEIKPNVSVKHSLFSLFYGISTFLGFLMPKPFF